VYTFGLVRKPSIEPDSLALARSPEETGAEELPWLERLKRLDRRVVVGAIAAFFLVLYAIGVRALRRGPGGGGFTHD
jgi:hypothetical protein